MWARSACSSEASLCDVATMVWQRIQIESLVPSDLMTCSKANRAFCPEAGGIGVAKKGPHFLRCIASGALLTLRAVYAEVVRGEKEIRTGVGRDPTSRRAGRGGCRCGCFLRVRASPHTGWRQWSV